MGLSVISKKEATSRSMVQAAYQSHLKSALGELKSMLDLYWKDAKRGAEGIKPHLRSSFMKHRRNCYRSALRQYNASIRFIDSNTEDRPARTKKRKPAAKK